MTTKSLTLSLDEQQSIPLRTVSGTQGYPGMDIRPLASAGICSFDPGFANTAGCTSAISWIDTENSVCAIAHETGFENIGYFCRRFKKLYGVTPIYYRNHCRSAE